MMSLKLGVSECTLLIDLLSNFFHKVLVVSETYTAVEIGSQLLRLLPVDGSPVLNRVLRLMLSRSLESRVSPDIYFAAIDGLAASGLVGRSRGQGGSVFLARSEAPVPPIEVTGGENWSEAKLMLPFERYLTSYFPQSLDLPTHSAWIVANTSAIGPRTGQWARPDFIAVSVMKFQLIPGRDLALHSFELKTESGGTVQAVHEALAQTRFTHFGHLIWHLPPGSKAEVKLPEIEKQCETHGIGLILIRDPSDFEKWEIRIDPQRKETSAATIDAFLLSRLSKSQIEHLKSAISKD
jgi:hypothetical protein